MTKRQEAAELVRRGMNPREIARIMSKTMWEIRTHLYVQVGEGALSRSDIFYSFSATDRALFDSHMSSYRGKKGYWGLLQSAERKAMDHEAFRIYLDCHSARVSKGDMYEHISFVETFLHDLVRQTLEHEFGPGDLGWWRKGVPLSVRISCATAKESDYEPAEHAYMYTTFINLSEILAKNWARFLRVLPVSVAHDKNRFLRDLHRLNHLRNSVMHPVKLVEITEDDFCFVKNFRRAIARSGV